MSAESPVIASVRQLLAGRDFRDPEEAALLVECLAVVVEDRLAALEPAVLQAAMRIVEEAAVTGQPELRRGRMAWVGYLRAVTGAEDVIDLNPN